MNGPGIVKPDRSRKRLLDVCLPLISVTIFLMVAEGLLWGIGYQPSMRRHGVEIPFWARNAGTFEHDVAQVVSRTRRLTDDVQAYQDDLYLFYRLRPHIMISVPFYDVSGKRLLGTFPDWILATDGAGNRCRPEGRVSRPMSNGPGKTVAIAIMGGSSFFGWGTDYENTFAAVLEANLRQHANGAFYRVTDHAVPGYAMSQQLRILQTMARRHTLPDWIILDATSNCGAASSITDHDREKRRLSAPGRLRYHLAKLKLFNLMEMVMMKWQPRVTEPDIGLPTVRIPVAAYPEYVHAFIDLARNHQISLILVGMCADGRYVGKLAEIAHNREVPMVDVYELFQHAVSLPGTGLFGRGEKQMVQQVYPAAMLKENPSLYFLFPDECHPNPTGHRLIAARLEKIIRKGMP